MSPECAPYAAQLVGFAPDASGTKLSNPTEGSLETARRPYSCSRDFQRNHSATSGTSQASWGNQRPQGRAKPLQATRLRQHLRPTGQNWQMHRRQLRQVNPDCRIQGHPEAASPGQHRAISLNLLLFQWLVMHRAAPCRCPRVRCLARPWRQNESWIRLGRNMPISRKSQDKTKVVPGLTNLGLRSLPAQSLQIAVAHGGDQGLVCAAEESAAIAILPSTRAMAQSSETKAGNPGRVGRVDPMPTPTANRRPTRPGRQRPRRPLESAGDAKQTAGDALAPTAKVEHAVASGPSWSQRAVWTAALAP